MVELVIGGKKYYVRRDETGKCYECKERFQTRIITESYRENDDEIAVTGERVLVGRLINGEEADEEFKKRLKEYFDRIRPLVIARTISLIGEIPRLREAVDDKWDEPKDEEKVEEYWKNEIFGTLGITLGYLTKDYEKSALEIVRKIEEERTKKYLFDAGLIREYKQIEIHPECANRLDLEELTERDKDKPRVWSYKTDLDLLLKHFESSLELQRIAKGINLEFMLSMKSPR